MIPDITKFNSEQIRNVVILAHVDHGKTTLTDSLLAHQGLISQYQAGQLRYMDFLPDEQRRGITMKSSAVSLSYLPINTRLYPLNKRAYLQNINLDMQKLSLNSEDNGAKEDNCHYTTKEILVNLIDTPGHVDFYGQVYCSSLLADGAIIMVDALEGICAQTLAAFRLAYELELAPVLFFNKLDRLILELLMTSDEIYVHLFRLLESINATCSIFRYHDKPNLEENEHPFSDNKGLEAEELDVFYFDPRKGNVLFGSAIDGWAFRLNIFANLFSKKIPTLSKDQLNKFLWGPYFLSKKTEICPIGEGKSSSPLFVSLILENICSIYKNLILESANNTEKIGKICLSFNVNFNAKTFKDRRSLLRLIFKSWISLAPSILDAITDSIPSARSKINCTSFIRSSNKSTDIKTPVNINAICATRKSSKKDNLEDSLFPKEVNDISIKPSDISDIDLKSFDNTIFEDQTVLAFLSKLIISQELTEVVLKKYISERKHNYDPFGDKILIEDSSDSSLKEIVMMGRLYSGTLSLTCKDLYFSSSFALSIGGDKKKDLYSTKISQFKLFQLMGSELIGVDQVPEGNIFGISGIIKEDGFFVKNGFLTSFPLDHAIEIYPPHSSSGLGVPLISVSIEPTLSLRDINILQYAMLILYQLDPSVNVVFSETGEMILEACGDLHLERCINELTSLISFPISVSSPIVPLGETIEAIENVIDSEILIKNNLTFFRDLNDIKIVDDQGNSSVHSSKLGLATEVHNAGSSTLLKVFLSISLVNGDDTMTPSILVINNVNECCPEYLHLPLQTAFNIAITNGPLCGEKVFKLKLVVHSITFSGDDLTDLNSIVTPLRRLIHMGILLSNPRLLQGYNDITINVHGDLLGKVYSLIAKAEGDIISGSEYIPETNTFTVHAHIPVRSSSALVDELRSKTAGAAFPNIAYHGLKIIKGLPPLLSFSEEIIDSTEDRSRLLIQETRSRKGLFISSKIMLHGEKQRTLRRS